MGTGYTRYIDSIDLYSLLHNVMYKQMCCTELGHIINWRLNREDYYKLEGKYSKDKAKKLKQFWNSDQNTTVMPISIKHFNIIVK